MQVRQISRYRHFDPMQLGQSSSRVHVEEWQGGVASVVKSTPARSERFVAQYQKHVQAARGHMAPLSVPRILEPLHGASYRMEFVHGLPLGTALSTATPQEVLRMMEPIVEYLSTSTESGGGDRAASQAVRQHLIVKATALMTDAVAISLGDRHEDLLALFLSSIEDARFAVGWNHGDLSFENVLADKALGKVWCIDFLDSPAETPLLDWGRLWLDAAFGWWGAGYWPSSNFLLNSRFVAKILADGARDIGIDVALLDAFAAFAVLRIAPYTVNPVRVAALKLAAQQVLGRSRS